MKKLFISVGFLLVSTFTVFSQQKITYDDVLGGLFAQKTVSAVRSMNDGESYTAREGNSIVKYSYRTGEKIGTIVDMAPSFRFNNYEFSADEQKILFSTDVERIYRHSSRANYWIYDIATGNIRALSEGGKQQVATFSPDGTKVAFVRDNNIFYVDLSLEKERQVTYDGRFNVVLNGIPDWVYEEEYSFARAYEWSPESDAIAYFRFDEERVKEYHMNFFQNQLYPSVYSFKYPKAGEENSVVTIHCYDLKTEKTTTVDIGSETDQYIPRIKWSARPGKLVVFRFNRLQNKFDMLLADAQTGNSEVFYTEENPRYIERINDETVTFLSDGDRFVIKSEKDGYMHLYLYSMSKGQLNQITKGPWDVTKIYGVDDKTSTIYYLSAETSPLRRNLYSIRLDGSRKKRLTDGDGMYSVTFSKGLKFYMCSFSNAVTPLTVTVHAQDGKLVRELENNAQLKQRLAGMEIPVKEFFSFTTSEGISLNGYMKKPTDFDPAKRYPVFMTQYSGPGSQQATDSWGVNWEDVLAQEGYIVVCVDGRGTGYRGEEFKKCTYRDLGRLEVVDQIEAARYMASQSYVDASRIGIYGWSYGGFMALNCILKGNDVFSMAIAVAPVTNWRYYDTIYTELYNGLPQDNPAGYDENSPIHFADRLKGKLLIVHGTGDDNVHPQNSYEMISELVNKGKAFDMFIYPDKNHSMLPGASRVHVYRTIMEYVRQNL